MQTRGGVVKRAHHVGGVVGDATLLVFSGQGETLITTHTLASLELRTMTWSLLPLSGGAAAPMARIDGAGALCFLPSAADGRTPRSPAPAEGLCEEQVAEFEEAFRLLGDAPTGKDVPFSEGELARERGGQAALRAVLQSLALEERL